MPEAASPQAPVPGQLVIEKTHEQGAVVLVLSGELDLASAPMLERELREAEAASPSRLVIDLGGLAFMDSTGLQALLRARERANTNGHQLALTACSAPGSARVRADQDGRRVHVRGLTPPRPKRIRTSVPPPERFAIASSSEA